MSRREPIRLALSPATGLSVLRWVGRVLALGSLWPIWYAFFGKVHFDWEAMVFGGPGLLIGLITWLWSGYALRHPGAYLEIDTRAGQLRLRSPTQAHACSFAELGPWQLRSWQVTTTHKGVRSRSTWYAARNDALGNNDLFRSPSREQCEAWTKRVDAAVRGENIGETGIEARLGAGFDRVLAKLERVLAGVVMPAVLIAYALGCWPYLAQTHAPRLEAAIVIAVLAAALALAWRALGRPWHAAATALLAGLALAGKPLYAPVISEYMGERHAYTLTSETHFYYLLPGLALCAVAVVFVLSPRARARPLAPADAPASQRPPAPPPPPMPSQLEPPRPSTREPRS